MERFNRLAHSIWDCKYHIVWIPKYRRKELYGKKKRIVVDTVKQWARIKGIEMGADTRGTREPPEKADGNEMRC
jgi:putative transposase